MRNDLIIFPFSGSGIEVLDSLGPKTNVYFISDDKNLVGIKYNDIEIFSREFINENPYMKVLTVHGSPNTYLQRQQVIDELNINKKRFISVIHPKAFISKNAIVGYNCFINAGVVITANVFIGNHVIVLPNSVIHHDSVVDDYSIICSNSTICGNVQVERNCYIGAATSIKNGITIGENSMIGIGTNVVKSVEKNSIIKGNPAK
jgi:acetyltransferase EpsM